MQTNKLGSKESSSKLDTVTKENWKNILDDSGITQSAISSLERETFNTDGKSTVQDMIEDSEISYTGMIDSGNQFVYSSVKMLKEWTKEDFEKSCKSIINGEMAIETAVDQFGIPEWLLQEKIQELGKKGLTKKSKVTKSTTKTRKRWSDESMEQAIFAVVNNNMSLRASAAKYNVPRSSLYDRIAPRKFRGKRKSDCDIDCSDMVLSDDKTWVIKSLQDGLITIDEAAFRLGLTNEETKSFCNSLGNAEFADANNAPTVTIIENSEDVVEETSRRKCETFEIPVENQIILDCDTIKPRMIENNSGVNDRTKRSSPVTETIDFSEESSVNQMEGQWTNATMLQQCDLRPDAVVSKSLTENSAPYTMLSGLNSWINALDSDALSTSTRNIGTKKWTPELMDKAIKDVKENGLSIRKSAIAHGIPKSSLADHISGRSGTKKRKNSCLKKGAMKELRSLAKTREQHEMLRLLKDGKVSFRIAAKVLGISYAKMRQFVNKDNEKKTIRNSKISPDVRNTISSDHEYERISESSVSDNKSKTKEEPQHNKPKRERVRWTTEDMEKALAAVKEGQMSIRCAAKVYNIPKSTLGDVVTGKCAIGRSPGPKRLLSDEEENALAGWLITMYRIGRQISIHEVLDTVKAILDKDGHRVPRLKNNLPKTSWWYGFLSRHKEVALLRKDLIQRCPKEIHKKEEHFSESVDDGKVEIVEQNFNEMNTREHITAVNELHMISEHVELDNDEDHDVTNSCAQNGIISSHLESLCGICGKSYAEVDCEETWISCGTVGVNEKLINGCGTWFHVKCTGLAKHTFTTDELKELTWFCQNCAITA